MPYFSSYGGPYSNEQFRKEYRKKLETGGVEPWYPPIDMLGPNLTDQWLVDDSNSRKQYYLPCHIRFGRCPFPQTLTFHAEQGDEMRVSYFHTEVVSKATALKHARVGDIDKRFPPFSFENTTPYQMARLANVLDWLCCGDFKNGRPTGSFPWNQEVNIFIKCGDRSRQEDVYVYATDGSGKKDERRLWNYEFFPPSGVEAIMELITEVRNRAIQWFW